MPRRADQIVAAIRARRRQVVRDVGDLTSARELGRRVRRAPEVWVLGGALAGLVAARFFAAPLLDTGKRGLRRYAWARLRSTLVAVAVAATGRVQSSGDGAGAGGTGPSASADVTGDRPSGIRS